MLDIGWSEMLLVAVIAIIVVGPKDLPRALRTVGRWTARVKAAAREFQGHVDEMIRESELDEIRKEADKITKFDLKEQVGARIVPDYDGTNTIAPTAAADPSEGEADADADYAAGAQVAPAHSLPEAEPQTASQAAESEAAEGRPANRASG